MKIGEKLGAAAVVLLITATVWVAADRSLLQTSPKLSVRVIVNGDDPNYRIRILKPDADGLHELRVTLVGPGRAIDKLLTESSRVVCRFSLSTAEAARAAAAEQLVLRPKDGLAWLAEQGLTLEECEPQEVVVKVARLEHKKVRVDLLPQDKGKVDDGYEIEPAEVDAVLTSAAKDRIGQQDWWAAPKIDLKSGQLISGQTDTQTVNLVPSTGDDPDIAFEPSQVKVKKLRLTAWEVPKIFAEKIPVSLQVPQNVFKEYNIEVDPAQISGLKIKGPASEIEGLSAQDIQAVLVLTDQDKPSATPLQRQLHIVFPPGREHVKVDGEPPLVNFTLKGRAAPPPS